MRLHGSLRPQGLDDHKAGVVKMADTQDLGSCGLVPRGFKSLHPHQGFSCRPWRVTDTKVHSYQSLSRCFDGGGSVTWPGDQSLRPSRDHHRGYLPITPGTLASGRACIGRLSSSFLAPQTLQTRWLATSGTGSRFRNPSDSGSI